MMTVKVEVHTEFQRTGAYDRRQVLTSSQKLSMWFPKKGKGCSSRAAGHEIIRLYVCAKDCERRG